ncbi:hypothetical protein PPACK8108_LOCUS162 [Phakopsora pachyrhizi]|uniref:Uncharacterized protein n=1 Tax=Phakopsora pachyrhizi TaxID=170000 RepID=A0AAV0AF66_PHAPC|nr:hypothetical protein PPACK8108_LOCUS162 [Phakopsora pachyrhizi]
MNNEIQEISGKEYKRNPEDASKVATHLAEAFQSMPLPRLLKIQATKLLEKWEEKKLGEIPEDEQIQVLGPTISTTEELIEILSLITVTDCSNPPPSGPEISGEIEETSSCPPPEVLDNSTRLIFSEGGKNSHPVIDAPSSSTNSDDSMAFGIQEKWKFWEMQQRMVKLNAGCEKFLQPDNQSHDFILNFPSSSSCQIQSYYWNASISDCMDFINSASLIHLQDTQSKTSEEKIWKNVYAYIHQLLLPAFKHPDEIPKFQPPTIHQLAEAVTTDFISHWTEISPDSTFVIPNKPSQMTFE